MNIASFNKREEMETLEISILLILVKMKTKIFDSLVEIFRMEIFLSEFQVQYNCYRQQNDTFFATGY